tara:strand:- start:1158 stop:1931 length:774 start_codon:yes stop_codon:yes gene_type:complete
MIYLVKKQFFIFLFFSCISFTGISQASKKSKFPMSFAINAKALIPTDFVGSQTTFLTNSPFESTVTQKNGYSFGGILRTSFSDFFSLETGIYFNQRQFDINMSVLDSGITAQNNMSFISYEIPIQGRIFVRLSKTIFSSVSLGISPNYKPSNVQVVTLAGGSHGFSHTGFSASKMGVDFNAEFGFERRDKKNGTIYFGAGAKIPLNNLFDVIGQYANQGNKFTDVKSVRASFLFVDLRYYLPTVKNPGNEFKEGPIE